MDWLKQLNEALDYLETHLDGEFDLDKAAQLAGCSSFHFQRMFSYMAGVPLSEYIRRRRMTRAALDLQNSRDKIIDVALRYGYDSPTAFNRAFRSIHGVAPSAARKAGTCLKSYQPISFKITIRGETEMNYRIENKETFRIVGPRLETSWTEEKKEAFQEVPQFWAQHQQKGTIPALLQLMDDCSMGIMGVSVGNLEVSHNFAYYIAVASDQPLPAGGDLHEYQIPAATWAVFECKGPLPGSIQKMSERIMTEWFPNSGYEYADAPDIEVYSEGDQSSEDYLCWVWVPIRK